MKKQSQSKYTVEKVKTWLEQGLTLTDVPPSIVLDIQDQYGAALHAQYRWEFGRTYHLMSLGELPHPIGAEPGKVAWVKPSAEREP